MLRRRQSPPPPPQVGSSVTVPLLTRCNAPSVLPASWPGLSQFASLAGSAGRICMLPAESDVAGAESSVTSAQSRAASIRHTLRALTADERERPAAAAAAA